jgi:UDP-sugar transporter A1/2/3
VGNVSGGRNSYLFTMELCVVSFVFMLTSMLKSGDGQRIRKEGFFHQWTPQTIIPILTNAAGGIVVGLVTKYAGSVKKGFALIFGLLLSGILQAIQDKDSGTGGKISIEHIVGGSLAAFSLWMHSAFPAAPRM